MKKISILPIAFIVIYIGLSNKKRREYFKISTYYLDSQTILIKSMPRAIS